MLDGWYCRSMANEQAAQQEEVTDPNMDDSAGSDGSQGAAQSSVNINAVDYKAQYRYLKQKLKFLVYENEFFQDALRSNQRRLLKVSRDRAFLLDRLLQYEKPENTSSESDETESSDDEAKKRKLEQNASVNNGSATGLTPRGRKKKSNVSATHAQPPPTTQPLPLTDGGITAPGQTIVARPTHELDEQQGHMTVAEVERHLQAKKPVMELMPERASATVPAEMFSNEPSLDSEPNDHHLMDGSSPTHVAAEECVPMEYSN